MGTFDYSNQGWKAAKNYLESIGKLEDFEYTSVMTDGYALIAYANSLKEQLGS